MLVVCTETTEQVLTARRLASERDRLAQLFEQAPSFMTVLRGPEHRFELANPAYLELVGNRALIGKTVAEALPETVEQGYIELLDQVFATGQAFVARSARYTQSPKQPGSRERFLDFVYQPIKDDAGQVTGIFVEGADVTERAEADAALRASETQFRALAAELADANRLKDEFVATLAHELRNPLAPIRNALSLMRRWPGGEVATRSRDVIERQVDQMVRLIDDLLDLSRVSRGLVELRRERLLLSEVLRGAVETSRPLIDQHGHTLTVTLPPEELTVDADPTRLVQIVANLLNNAAKFTSRGGRIELGLQREGTQGAVVWVRDNGVGIPREMLERVFDLFTQVDRSHAQVSGGLGIGLTLVRRLVDMHGGRIQAYSDGPGEGSEFRIHLPLATAPGDAAAASAAPDDAVPAVRRRILVADDNVDAAESLAMILDSPGARDAHGPRRGTGAGGRARVPSRRHGRRHRDAQAERARAGPARSYGAVGPRRPLDCVQRVGPGREQARFPGRRVRPSPGQTGRDRHAGTPAARAPARPISTRGERSRRQAPYLPRAKRGGGRHR